MDSNWLISGIVVCNKNENSGLSHPTLQIPLGIMILLVEITLNWPSHDACVAACHLQPWSLKIQWPMPADRGVDSDMHILTDAWLTIITGPIRKPPSGCSIIVGSRVVIVISFRQPLVPARLRNHERRHVMSPLHISYTENSTHREVPNKLVDIFFIGGINLG